MDVLQEGGSVRWEGGGYMVGGYTALSCTLARGMDGCKGERPIESGGLQARPFST